MFHKLKQRMKNDKTASEAASNEYSEECESSVEHKEINEELIPELENARNAENSNEDNLSDTEKKCLVLEAERNEWKDKYVRLVSEFDNYRKRTAKEKLELTMTASESVILSLLPVVDDFERALEAFQKTVSEEDRTQAKALEEGVELIYEKLIKTLEKQSVKAVDCLHKTFDPEVSEAIAQIPAPDPKLKNCVLDVVEKPYIMNEKVIRYGKVAVGN